MFRGSRDVSMPSMPKRLSSLRMVHMVYVMSKTQRKCLPIRILYTVSILDKKLGYPGHENVTISTHIIREPVVLVTNRDEVLFLPCEEIP